MNWFRMCNSTLQKAPARGSIRAPGECTTRVRESGGQAGGGVFRRRLVISRRREISRYVALLRPDLRRTPGAGRCLSRPRECAAGEGKPDLVRGLFMHRRRPPVRGARALTVVRRKRLESFITISIWSRQNTTGMGFSSNHERTWPHIAAVSSRRSLCARNDTRRAAAAAVVATGKVGKSCNGVSGTNLAAPHRDGSACVVTYATSCQRRYVLA